LNYLILFIGMLAVSFSPACNSVLVKEIHYSGLQVGAIRLLLASFGLLTVPHLWKTRQLIKTNAKVLLKSGFLLAVHFYFWTSAFAYSSLSSLVIFLAAQPLVSILMTFRDKKERISFSFLLCLLITIAGLLTIFWEDWKNSNSSAMGNIFVLIAEVAIVSYQLSIRKISQKMPWITFNFSVWLIAGGLLFVAASLYNLSLGLNPWQSQKISDWQPAQGLMAVCCLAFVCTYMGHGCYNIVIPRLKLVVINLSAICLPVISIFIGTLIGIDTWPTGIRLVGSIVTVVGMATALIFDFKTHKKTT